MVKTAEKSFGGIGISVTQFAGIEGFKIKTRLVKLIAPSIGELAGGAGGNVKSVGDIDLGSGFIGKAVNALCDKLDENESFAFVMRMLRSSGARVEGREVDDTVFNDVFAGNYKLLYQILYLIIEENYGNFFGDGGIGAMLSKLPVKKI